MGRRQRRRRRQDADPSAPIATSDYTDDEGNVLTLRDELSAGTLRKLADLDARPAANAEDRWQRRVEFLFERLAVRWEIAGLPLEAQRELLGATGWRQPTSAGRCARRSRSTCASATRRSTSTPAPDLGRRGERRERAARADDVEDRDREVHARLGGGPVLLLLVELDGVDPHRVARLEDPLLLLELAAGALDLADLHVALARAADVGPEGPAPVVDMRQPNILTVSFQNR